MTRPVYVTPAERIAELVRVHGSYRAAADVIGFTHSYLYRVEHGQKEAGDGLLAKLGLEKQVRYLRIGA